MFLGCWGQPVREGLQSVECDFDMLQGCAYKIAADLGPNAACHYDYCGMSCSYFIAELTSLLEKTVGYPRPTFTTYVFGYSNRKM